MAMVNKKPILEHLVNHLNKAGITEIIVNIHKNYEPIFKYFGTRLLYFYEPTLLGEHGTELALQDWLGDEYIVMNGDTLTNLDLKTITEFNKKSVEFWSEQTKHYAGTKFVNKKSIVNFIWYSTDYWYFDCGTPEKLAKARRFYARK